MNTVLFHCAQTELETAGIRALLPAGETQSLWPFIWNCSVVFGASRGLFGAWRRRGLRGAGRKPRVGVLVGKGAPWLVVDQPPGSEGRPIPSGPSGMLVPRDEGDLVPWIGEGTDPPWTTRAAGPPGSHGSGGPLRSAGEPANSAGRSQLRWGPASMGPSLDEGRSGRGRCPSDSRCTAQN